MFSSTTIRKGVWSGATGLVLALGAIAVVCASSVSLVEPQLWKGGVGWFFECWVESVGLIFDVGCLWFSKRAPVQLKGLGFQRGRTLSLKQGQGNLICNNPQIWSACPCGIVICFKTKDLKLIFVQSSYGSTVRQYSTAVQYGSTVRQYKVGFQRVAGSRRSCIAWCGRSLCPYGRVRMNCWNNDGGPCHAPLPPPEASPINKGVWRSRRGWEATTGDGQAAPG